MSWYCLIASQDVISHFFSGEGAIYLVAAHLISV
jgi:hypothetical protein